MTTTKSFADLKKSRQSQLERLSAELDKLKSGSVSSSDDAYWYPILDKNGSGSAVIRFLPAHETEEVPFVRIFEHGFKGPTGLWYIEKSRTTIGEKDPVSEYNSELWNKSDDDNSPTRKQARLQKRRLQFVANVYIIEDPANPDNVGKVKLFKFGKKIFDKLNEKMSPEFEDEEAMNPFDLWEGANFKLRIRKHEGYTNYDKSSFDSPSALLSTDEEREAVWKQVQKLQPLIAPSEFKSYTELKARLNEVLGKNNDASAPAMESPAHRAAETPSYDEDDPPFEVEPKKTASKTLVNSDDDDDFKFFEELKNQ